MTPGYGAGLGERPETNLYSYTVDDPVNRLDPLGLWNCKAKEGCNPNAAMNRALKCLDTCAGADVNVTFAQGHHADLGRRANPSLCRDKMEQCFAECFSEGSYGQEERNNPAKYPPNSTHYHLLSQPSKSGTTGFQEGVIGYNQSR